MKEISLLKISGAGNTFNLIDARKGSAFGLLEARQRISRRKLAIQLCSVTTGIGSDGFLFLDEGNQNCDFVWDFYNADGSTAEMCGNAARCVALFCKEEGLSHKKSLRFQTGAGIVTTELISEDRVLVSMPPATVVKNPILLKTHNGATESFCFVNTGVPHLVQKIHEMSDVEALKEMASEIRHHKDLGEAGSNVTFYVVKDKSDIAAITFERGVENYTLACGTGAVAAALASYLENEAKNIKVTMPGGILEVNFSKGYQEPLMSGPAHTIGRFNFNMEGLK